MIFWTPTPQEIPLTLHLLQLVQKKKYDFPLKVDRPSSLYVVSKNRQRYVVKTYHRRHFAKTLRNLLLLPRAFSAYRLAYFFLEKSIPTPSPIAAVYQPLVGIAHLITPYLPAQSLHQLLPHHSAEFFPPSLPRLLGKAVGKMHRACVFHNDLKTSNILWQPHPPYFHFVDLDHSQQTSVFSLRLASRDLSCLLAYGGWWAKKWGCLRFIRSYLQANPLPSSLRDKLFQKTLQKTHQRRLQRKSLPPQYSLPF